MLTRKKRIGIDSSPKTSANKNFHLLSKETMQDTVNMLSTPTRRNRFMLGTNQKNMNDESPVLSQEPINISWKWNNEGTPIRATNKTSKLVRRSITNNSPQLKQLERLSTNRYNIENRNNMTATITATAAAAATTKTTTRITSTTSTHSPKIMAELETHSPKGLYKFQEEMRKIEFDTESDTSCDNFNDKSMTADTGYPTSTVGKDAPAEFHTNYKCINDSLDTEINMNGNVRATTLSQNGIDNDLANDLMDDSDFDQFLLTCQIPNEKKQTDAIVNQTIKTNQLNVKKASSAPEIKSQNSSNNSDNSGSNWMLDDDCFDDLVKDFDVDIPMDSLNTSAKFTRHKSMPQHPQTPTTSNTRVFKLQKSTSKYHNQNINRKSFTRHESMPITNSSINRSSNNNNNINKQANSALSSTQSRKCTSEEIAEKRRIALERLKHRKQLKTK